MFKQYMYAAAVAVMSLTGTASAATLNGSFTIDIYNYNAGGSSANAAATTANVAAQTLLASITYDGDLDFSNAGFPNTTIQNFLDSGMGTIVTVVAGNLNTLLSSPTFQTTTLLDIKGVLNSSYKGKVRHDDGVSIFDSTGQILNSANPTVAITSPFTSKYGDFRLIYAAANGNPSILNVDVAAVPVPAAGLLLVGALGGLAALRRRKA